MSTVWTSLLEPFVDPGSRTFWPTLLVAVFVAAGMSIWQREGAIRTLRAIVSRSGALDLQLLISRQLLAPFVKLPLVALGYGFATHAVRRLDVWLGIPEAPDWSATTVTALYTVVLFVAWDLSRFVLHRLMHGVGVLWAFHQVHHSAESLSPLTFHRIHPVESLLYQLRGLVVTTALATGFFWVFRAQAVPWTLFGVHGIGLILNALTGNLRHSHVWLRFGPLEDWLISPAQHQVHHAADPAYHHANYGTWLAIWDRLSGTLIRAPEAPPTAYGVTDRNHDHNLISAWFGPFRALGRGWTAMLLLMPGLGRAEEPEDADMELIVYAEDGIPRVAGSAYVVDEEELERFEYDDVHKVLSYVPSVTVRGEDGFGLRPNIGIRGANSDRSAKITLLEDGVLLGPAPYAAPAAYFFPMATRLTGVEVFKGAAATLHGPQTIGGAVNLLTRAVPSDGPDGRLDVGIGQRSSAKVHGWAGAGNDRGGWLFEGAQLSTGGFKELDGGGDTGFRRADTMLKGRVIREGDLDHIFTLKLGYAHERSHETYLGLSADDAEATPYRRYAASSEGLMRWHRSQAELSWRVRNDHLDIRSVAYHHFLTRQWTKLNGFMDGTDVHALLQSDGGGQAGIYQGILEGEVDSTSDGQRLAIGTNDRRFHATGIQTRGIWQWSNGLGWTSRAQFGARLHVDRVARLHTQGPAEMRDGRVAWDGVEDQTLLDSDATAVAFSVNAHEDLAWNTLHVLPSARLEAIHTAYDNGNPARAFRPIVLPGAAILWEARTWLDLFGGIHEGFSPVSPSSAPDVLPERSWNSELGVRVGTADTHGEVVGFVNDYQNITGQCTFSGGCQGDQLDQQFNGGRALIWGAELVGHHRAPLPARLTLMLDGSYTLTRATFSTSFVSGFPQYGTVNSGDALPYVPVHQGSARLGLQHQRFTVSLGATGRSGMLDEAGLFPVTEADLPGRVLVDVAARGQITRGLEIYSTITNLTNVGATESWRPFGSRPVAPFQAMIGVKIDPPRSGG